MRKEMLFWKFEKKYFSETENTRKVYKNLFRCEDMWSISNPKTSCFLKTDINGKGSKISPKRIHKFVLLLILKVCFNEIPGEDKVGLRGTGYVQEKLQIFCLFGGLFRTHREAIFNFSVKTLPKYSLPDLHVSCQAIFRNWKNDPLKFHRNLTFRVSCGLSFASNAFKLCTIIYAIFYVDLKNAKKASKTFCVKSYGLLKLPRYFASSILVVGSERVKLSMSMKAWRK